MSCCQNEKKKSAPSPSTQEKKATKVHPQMTIEEILSMFPNKAQRLAQEITNAGLHCVGCHAATWETLEAGMKGHGMDEKAIDHLVRRLNALLEEQEDNNTISLTERAAEKFLEILQEDGKPGLALRFGEMMAGCNGFEYLLDYSEKANADDAVYESHGVKIHVKKSMLPRLLGCVIDYVDGLRGSGFKITNPNVKSACGCGTSHNY